MNPERPLGPHGVKPLRLDPQTADSQRGQTLYRKRCAHCHGNEGRGDADNPPLWGDQSYNAGAGFASDLPLASWLKVAMPRDDTDLTDQEALDVAAFVNAHPRPGFRLEEHLPPPERRGEYNANP